VWFALQVTCNKVLDKEITVPVSYAAEFFYSLFDASLAAVILF
jgi:hypothetical protein